VSALVEVEPSAWDELLGRLGCADVYLLGDYVASARLLEEGRPRFLHLEGDEGDVVFVSLVREVPSGTAYDVITPYGYGGPVATGSNPPTRQFWQLYQDWCEANGILTSFIRFHPLFANQRYAGPGVRVEPLAGTVGWRLDQRDLLATMHSSQRNACRKALREGVTVTAVQSPADLAWFASLYELTMRRLGARDFYLFSEDYWDLLATRLRDRIVLFEAGAAGEVVASALTFQTPPWLHYHLAATSDRGRTLGASNLVLYEAAVWAQQRGCERFHLGGGGGGDDDSLLSFKRRFDPGGMLECAVGKAVHDPVAYRALSGREAGDLAGFFPAYRAAGRT